MNLFGGFIVDPAQVRQLAWTLLHFLWQGVVVLVVLELALSAIRKYPARVRYGAACAALVALVCAPIVTYSLLSGAFDDPGSLVLPFDTGASAVQHSALGRWWAGLATWLEPALPRLVATWIILAVAICAWQLCGLILLEYRVRRHSLPLDVEWQKLTQLAQRMGLSSVRFVESRFVEVPATVGWLRPLVLLPATALTGVPSDQLEALLAHELAHIRRYDYLVNLIQSLIETLFFYHPAVWLVSHRIRVEREHCCDEIAAEVCGDPALFGQALVTIECLRPDRPMHALGAAGAGRLAPRINRLREMSRNRRRRGRSRNLIASLIGLCAICVTAGSLWASSVPMQPQHVVSEVRSPAELVYQSLGIATPGTPKWLPELAAAITDVRAENKQLRLRKLAIELNTGSGPHDLVTLYLTRIRLRSPFGYERARDWEYGTYADRAALTTKLYDEAVAASSRSDARMYGRAALLLASQDDFRFGVGGIYRLLNDPQFKRVADVSDRQLARLRRGLQDHLTITRVCMSLRVRAERLVERARSAPEDPSIHSELANTVEAMLSIAGERPDVRLQVAELALEARLAGVDLTDWVLAHECAREHSDLWGWLAEARSAGPDESRSVQVVTEEELDKLIRTKQGD